jgi:Protein of unknown function (DUF1616)
LADKQPYTEKIQELIIDILKKNKPQTSNELITLIQQQYPVPQKEISAILIRLEEANKIHFAKKILPQPATVVGYLFSAKSLWFWLSLIVSMATAVSVFIVPENAYPLTYLRQTLGTIFVLFLPGYTFLKLLYPTKVPIATSSDDLDTIERFALSIGLSIALTAIVGLILNYTPWGIRLAPITFSLLVSTIVFSIAGLIREYQAKATFVCPSKC